MGISTCMTIQPKSLIPCIVISTMYLNYRGTPPLNYINNLKNLLLAQSIWIIGSDPTLNDYPDDFMDDKNGMALHLAYEKFQTDFTYANEIDRVRYLNKQKGYVDKQNIYGFPFYRKTVDESVTVLNPTCWLLNLTPFPPNGKIDDIHTEEGQVALKLMVYKAKRNKSVTFGGYGTCLHGAIYAALCMGVNEVNIIGSGFQTIEGENHFKEAEKLDNIQRPDNPDFSDNAFDERTLATETILDEMKLCGISSNWYKTYQEISGQHA